ncbi:MAG: FlgD immunoglobulin-like domain containing protein [bacterium]
MNRVLCLIAAMFVVASLALPAAHAQSVNIDFGSGVTAPSATYAAAGPAGAWNEIGVLAPAARAPLVGLDGAPVAAEIYMIGGTALSASDDPATSGDDGALVDDMLIGYNNPVDVCVWVEDLVNGTYEVLIYALTPNNPALLHRVRVDFATPDATMIGGAWPSAHIEGVTFERFTVDVTNGKIGLHSGLWAGNFESGINGIQVIDAATSVGGASPWERTGARIARVWPNPASGAQRFELTAGDLRAAGGVSSDVLRFGTSDALAIHDASGRLVWRRSLAGLGASASVIDWDGRDAEGRALASGVYFVKVESARDGASSSEARKIVRVR